MSSKKPKAGRISFDQAFHDEVEDRYLNEAEIKAKYELRKKRELEKANKAEIKPKGQFDLVLIEHDDKDANVEIDVGSEDPYEVLGLPIKSTTFEITKRFRRLAMQLHPDRNPAQNSKVLSDQFRRVSEAYELLKDPETRRYYDTHGVRPLSEYDLLSKARSVVTSKLKVVCEQICTSDEVPLEKLWTISPVSIAKDLLGKDRENMVNTRTQARKQLKKLTTLIGRFHRKTKDFEKTMLGVELIRQRKSLETTSRNLKRDLEVMDKAILIVGVDYDYELDAPKPPPTQPIYSTTSFRWA